MRRNIKANARDAINDCSTRLYITGMRDPIAPPVNDPTRDIIKAPQKFPRKRTLKIVKLINVAADALIR